MKLTRRHVLAGSVAGIAGVGLAAVLTRSGHRRVDVTSAPNASEADDVIDAQGDSLTFGWGSHGVGPGEGPYPLQLQRLLSARYERPIAVMNRGISGGFPRTSSSRSNGQPMRMSVAGDVIPAEGPVALTNWNANPITDQAREPLTGLFAGIRGTLAVVKLKPTFDPNAMVFIRAEPGPPVTVAPMSDFYTDLGMSARGHAKLMVYGRNGQKIDQIVAAIDGDVAYQNAPHKRWLVGSVMTAVTEIGTPAQGQIRSINDALAARYGDNYVELDTAPTPEEMAAIGFVPDRGGPFPNGRSDRSDMAAGVIPSGMRLGGPGDNQHFNNFGYALWALRFEKRIVEKRWFVRSSV